MKLRVFFLLLIMGASSHLYSKSEVTQFRFERDENSHLRGRCYEYDVETNGQRFLVKAPLSKCRPSDTSYYWLQTENQFRGRCYEVATEGGNDRFVTDANIKNCYPDKISYHIIESRNSNKECILVDAEDNSRFRLKVDSKFCIPKETSYRWKVDRQGHGGQCFEVDEKSGGLEFSRKVSHKLCRPTTPSYNFLKGNCYEVHPKQSHRGYSKRVNAELCYSKKSDLQYLFNSENGKCYESTLDLQGQKIQKETALRKCRPSLDNISYLFQRLDGMRAVCLEVDKETEGQYYSKRADIEKCRQKQLSYIYKLSNAKCYEMDEVTSGEKFLKPVKQQDCLDQNGVEYRWVAHPSEWGGHCQSVTSFKQGKEKVATVSSKLCRPAKHQIGYRWFNRKEMEGNCYEMDKINGSTYYSKIVSKKKCLPKQLKYRFYQDSQSTEGSCYQVDSKTGGDQYNIKVGDKFCRKLLHSTAPPKPLQ